MAIINFKEIAQANTGCGEQDDFELFTRDFLKHRGFQIISDPARGADGGADLIVEEIRTGIVGETKIRWLVSCKHYAHSGKSVSHQDEINIRDRVDSHNCQGFIGFYSTIATQGLRDNLKGNEDKLEFKIFDRRKIEDHLLRSSDGIKIAARYFPTSHEKWARENPEPAKVFAETPSLKCQYCQKELLDPEADGIIVEWKQRQVIKEIYWCCKGHCDSVLSNSISQNKLVSSWTKISDVTIPVVFIKWVMTILNENRSGIQYSDKAFKQLKDFLLNVFPHVSRENTEKEKERVQMLQSIPASLGGLGD